MPQKNNLLGLDVGSKRIGLAIVADGVAVPRSLPFLINDESIVDNIKTILTEKKIDELVVGLPRNLDGDDTPQTVYVRQFVDKLASNIKLPIYLQDEALTSAVAENILKADNKSYQKGDIDSLAAARILLDYLLDLPKAPTTPDLLLESSTSFSAGDVSTDTPSSDKISPELPKAKPVDGAILGKSSIGEV